MPIPTRMEDEHRDSADEQHRRYIRKRRAAILEVAPDLHHVPYVKRPVSCLFRKHTKVKLTTSEWGGIAMCIRCGAIFRWQQHVNLEDNVGWHSYHFVGEYADPNLERNVGVETTLDKGRILSGWLSEYV